MYMYLPVALTSMNVLVLGGIGFAIGLLSGLFGVGGGFLITPILMWLGISGPVAAASGSCQIIGASASGAYAHWKLGNVDVKMGLLLILGAFSGGFLGVQIIHILMALGNADFLIKVTYIIMPLTIGSYMVFESLRNMKGDSHLVDEDSCEIKKPSMVARFLASLPFQTRFERSNATHSIFTPIMLGILVGILAAIMGVGGGFIMVPIMLYFLRMPMHVVVGTSLFEILFTVIEVTFLQAYTNHVVDFILALIMLVGSTIGAQMGAIMAQRLKAEQLKILLGLLILAVGIKVLLGLLLHPSLLLSYKGIFKG